MKGVNISRVDKFDRRLDGWEPPENAEKFIHSSINFCDAMDTGNSVLDYNATVTGTTGITGHALDQLKDHNFDTYWQADSGVADDDQYFELELSDAVYCDSYIMNFNKPQEYRTPPYTPYPNCWKAWIIKGKLNAGDDWTTLETVSANTAKFYHGTFTRNQYKYFRVESISAYDDVSQSNRIDAYLYNAGIYESTTKYHDIFPAIKRGRNDYDSESESEHFTSHDIYINKISYKFSDVYDLNGDISRVVKGVQEKRHRHIGGLWTELDVDVAELNYPQSLTFTRLNSLDFTDEADICLYMFPPPNEIWYFLASGYAFDETSTAMNTPVVLKVPDNACDINPSWTTIRTYTSYAVLGARYKDTLSGEFKVNLHYITFSDAVNMQSQIKFDGQECKGLITDMDGTLLTGASNAVSNVTVGRLKIGDIWRGYQANIIFDPPIKLDGDDPTHTFEIHKDEKILGSVFRFTTEGFMVPKPTGD